MFLAGERKERKRERGGKRERRKGRKEGKERERKGGNKRNSDRQTQARMQQDLSSHPGRQSSSPGLSVSGQPQTRRKK